MQEIRQNREMKKIHILIGILLTIVMSGCSGLIDGSLDVAVQDQTTKPFSLRMNKQIQTNLTLSTNTIINIFELNMNPGHGLITGDHIIIIEENGEPNYFFGEIISVNNDIIEMDTLMTYPFNASKARVIQYDPDLNVDGSVTPYIAELCNPFTIPIDINRFIIQMTDGSAMDSSKFGGLDRLTRGISLRKKVSDEYYIHYWNAKDNSELKVLGYDLDYDNKAPAGVFGMTFRLSYNGLDKHGVVIRLRQGQCIELPIVDDLTGQSSILMIAEGSFTEGEEEEQ